MAKQWMALLALLHTWKIDQLLTFWEFLSAIFNELHMHVPNALYLSSPFFLRIFRDNIQCVEIHLLRYFVFDFRLGCHANALSLGRKIVIRLDETFFMIRTIFS